MLPFALVFSLAALGADADAGKSAASDAFNQAARLAQSGMPAKALTVMQEFVDAQDLNFKVASPQSCWARIFQSQLLQHLNQAPKALEVVQEASKNLRDRKSREMAAALNREGLVLKDLGDYALAKERFLQAEKLGREVLGEDIELAVILSNLGLICTGRNEFAEAERALKQSLALLARIDQAESEMAALAHQNLSSVYYAVRHLEDCDREQLRAHKIKEKVFRSPHRSLANSFANRAMFLKDVGRLIEAVDHAKKAVQMLNELNMSQHLDMAQMRVIYANCLILIPDFDAAFRELQAAKKIVKTDNGFPDGHPLLLHIYAELGNYYLAALEANRGGKVHEDNVVMYNQLVVLLTQDPSLRIKAKNNLAVLAAMKGEYAEAIKQYTEVMAEAEKLPEGKQGHLMTAYLNRGTSNLAAGNTKAAVQDAEKAHALQGQVSIAEQIRIDSTYAVALWMDKQLPAAERAFDRLLQDCDEVVFNAASKASLLQQREIARQYSGVLSGALSMVARHPEHKGLVELGWVWTANTKHRVPEATALRQQMLREINDSQVRDSLQAVHREFAALRLGKNVSPVVQTRLKELREEESALMRKAGLLRDPAIKEWVDVAKFRKSIASDSVVVECVSYAPLDPVKNERQSPRYLAWVISGDPQQPIQLIDLGDGKALDEKIHRAVDQIATTRTRLGTITEKDAFAEDRTVLRGLHEAIWEPLAKHFGSAKRVYVCPDGLLWKTPWNCLVDGSDKFLVESFYISQLGSSRYLVPVSAKATAAVAEQKPLLALAMAKELPNTREEGQTLLDVFQVKAPDHLFVDQEATEDLLHTLAPPRVVYFGAHTAEIANVANASAQANMTELLASHAIVLSQSKQEDGRLTGLEILDLPFQQTELVILAVCDSAAGGVQTNEGIECLQHAFCLAGAKNVVGTNWQLPAKFGTTEILQDFTKGLAQQPDYARLIAAAQQRHIAAMRARKSPPLPYYWGAFSLITSPQTTNVP